MQATTVSIPPILADVFFYTSFALAIMALIVLIVASRRPKANFWFAGIVVPGLLGIIYTIVMIMYWFDNPPGHPFDFFSLGGLGTLFASPGRRAAAFIDILLLTVIVAAWMVRRAAQARIPWVYLVICLLITFALPGTGVVLYVTLVAMKGRLNNVAEFEAVPCDDSEEVDVRPW